MEIVKLFYEPANILINNSESSFYMAFVFIGLLILSFLINKGKLKLKYIWPHVLAFSLWIMFGLIEYYMHVNKVDIRIDLLMTWPIMFVISLYAILIFIMSLFDSNA